MGVTLVWSKNVLQFRLISAHNQIQSNIVSIPTYETAPLLLYNCIKTYSLCIKNSYKDRQVFPLLDAVNLKRYIFFSIFFFVHCIHTGQDPKFLNVLLAMFNSPFSKKKKQNSIVMPDITIHGIFQRLQQRLQRQTGVQIYSLAVYMIFN